MALQIEVYVRNIRQNCNMFHIKYEIWLLLVLSISPQRVFFSHLNFLSIFTASSQFGLMGHTSPINHLCFMHNWYLSLIFSIICLKGPNYLQLVNIVCKLRGNYQTLWDKDKILSKGQTIIDKTKSWMRKFSLKKKATKKKNRTLMEH